MIFAPAIAAFAASFACLWLMLTVFRGRLPLDRPTERSLHAAPVPRGGGIAVCAGVAASLLFAPADAMLGIAAVLAALSLVDDHRSLPVWLRLAAHMLGACAAVALLVGPADWPTVTLLVLAIVWFTNLYNFMDGADGLAGGMAIVGFGAYATAAFLSGNAALAATCASLGAAAAAFLAFNYPPARVFLGDVGAIPLGFLAGALGVEGWREGHWPLWFPVLVFAPFVCDATLTLLRRLLRRERLSAAHRNHYYQRLARMEFGHRGTAWIEYTAMLGCAAAALSARQASAEVQYATLAGAATALGMIAVWIDWRWARHLRRAPESAA